MNATLSPDITLVEVLSERLRACTSTPDGIERPHAIVWTDPREHWRSLIPDLVKAMPELLIYGEYDPDTRTGPAIWLRCMIDRSLEHPPLPAGPLGFGVRRATFLLGPERKITARAVADIFLGSHLDLIKAAIKGGSSD